MSGSNLSSISLTRILPGVTSFLSEQYKVYLIVWQRAKPVLHQLSSDTITIFRRLKAANTAERCKIPLDKME